MSTRTRSSTRTIDFPLYMVSTQHKPIEPAENVYALILKEEAIVASTIRAFQETNFDITFTYLNTASPDGSYATNIKISSEPVPFMNINELMIHPSINTTKYPPITLSGIHHLFQAYYNHNMFKNDVSEMIIPEAKKVTDLSDANKMIKFLLDVIYYVLIPEPDDEKAKLRKYYTALLYIFADILNRRTEEKGTYGAGWLSSNQDFNILIKRLKTATFMGIANPLLNILRVVKAFNEHKELHYQCLIAAKLNRNVERTIQNVEPRQISDSSDKMRKDAMSIKQMIDNESKPNAKTANAKTANVKPANVKPANVKPANVKPANVNVAIKNAITSSKSNVPSTKRNKTQTGLISTNHVTEALNALASNTITNHDEKWIELNIIQGKEIEIPNKQAENIQTLEVITTSPKQQVIAPEQQVIAPEQQVITSSRLEKDYYIDFMKTWKDHELRKYVIRLVSKLDKTERNNYLTEISNLTDAKLQNELQSFLCYGNTQDKGLMVKLLNQIKSDKNQVVTGESPTNQTQCLVSGSPSINDIDKLAAEITKIKISNQQGGRIHKAFRKTDEKETILGRNHTIYISNRRKYIKSKKEMIPLTEARKQDKEKKAAKTKSKSK